jgi:hypothetical protein
MQDPLVTAAHHALDRGEFADRASGGEPRQPLDHLARPKVAVVGLRAEHRIHPAGIVQP